MALGLQLWVNLKSTEKLCDPAYQELKNEQVPEATHNGVTAKIIAGEAFGVQSPVYTRTPTVCVYLVELLVLWLTHCTLHSSFQHYIHFRMQPNSQLEQPVPAGWNAFMYIIDGKVAVGAESSDLIDAHNLILLNQGGDGVIVRTLDDAAELVVISGEPIGEPVAQHGKYCLRDGLWSSR